MKTCFSILASLVFCPLLALAQDKAAHKLTFERKDGIWLANIDGTGAKQVAHGQSPELSSDGTRIAYNTVQDIGQPAHRLIAVLDLSTGKSTLLKEVPSDNSMAARWSPDGKQILFEYYAHDNRFLATINADGTGFHDIQKSEPKHQDYWSETWAADGKSIFAQDMANLYQLDLDGKVLKKWPVEKLVPQGGMSGNIRLDASPDGKSLLMDVEMDEKERKGWDGPPPSIWLLDLATEKAVRLTPKSLYAWDCHWLDAPDSILFISTDPDQDRTDIYRMSTTGQGEDRKLLVKDATGPSASQ